MLDLYLWRREAAGEPERVVLELAAELDAVAFPRPVQRIVVAMSGADSGPRTAGGEDFTFRPTEDGYREGPLYRGIHPMIAKRLDLWRLSNFELQRLSSDADLYLYHGVARDNPKDERLFAVARGPRLHPGPGRRRPGTGPCPNSRGPDPRPGGHADRPRPPPLRTPPAMEPRSCCTSGRR